MEAILANNTTPSLRRRSKRRKLTVEERRKLYDSLPAGNKYIEQARKTQGHLRIYDPAFML